MLIPSKNPSYLDKEKICAFLLFFSIPNEILLHGYYLINTVYKQFKNLIIPGRLG